MIRLKSQMPITIGTNLSASAACSKDQTAFAGYKPELGCDAVQENTSPWRGTIS